MNHGYNYAEPAQAIKQAKTAFYQALWACEFRMRNLVAESDRERGYCMPGRGPEVLAHVFGAEIKREVDASRIWFAHIRLADDEGMLLKTSVTYDPGIQSLHATLPQNHVRTMTVSEASEYGAAYSPNVR